MQENRVPPDNDLFGARWNDLARWWDSVQGECGDAYRTQIIYPWIFSHLGPLMGKRVLDLGCGNGSLCRLLANSGATVVGLDVSSEMISHAQRRSSQHHIQYVAGDITILDMHFLHVFTDVVSVFSLQDMPNPALACAKVYRRLAPGGVFLIVLEQEYYMRSIGHHATTKRVWTHAPETKSHDAVQLIYWNDGDCTYSFVRPLIYYERCLTKAGFTLHGPFALKPTTRLADSIFPSRIARDGNRLLKFVGLIALKRTDLT